MPIKSVAAQVKATAVEDANLQEGQFTALASVFNNVDAVGDVVLPGAFADDLQEWQASGNPIPVYWGHRMEDPHMNIGQVLESKETDSGLLVKAQLDLENPTAAQVYRLIKGGRVSRMSFAYDILDGAPAERDGQQVFELRKLKVHEVSVVQVPANPAAGIQTYKHANSFVPGGESAGDTEAAAPCRCQASATDAKADPAPDTKAGRTLSAKNEDALRNALGKIADGVTDVKAVLSSIDSTDGKASPTQLDAAEEPDGAKVAGVRSRPASIRLLTDLDALAFEVSSEIE